MRNYALREFTALQVSGNFIVEVNQGDFSVSLDVPEDMERYLNVSVKDGELIIGYEHMPFKLRRLVELKKYKSIAKIVLPQPEEISVSGATKLVAKDIKAVNLSIGCSGASNLDVSGEFGQLEVDCSGACNSRFSGTARILDLSLSGAGKTDALDLVCNNAKLETSGASASAVYATDRLQIDCSGASKVSYKIEDGTRLEVESSGASKISRIR